MAKKSAYPHNPRKDCDMCFGRGYMIHSSQDRKTGKWTREEKTCGSCMGTGLK